ncbi:MAG: hypothetical protein AAGD11_06115 [Planctomycetota bacterium]
MRCLISVVLVFSLTGCSSSVFIPRILSPGPAPFQRNNAQQFDPYPQNDLGPEIVGGRPLGYMIPPDEVTRARQQTPIAPWRAAPLY